MSYTITSWQNCYDDGWKGLLYEDKELGESAFSHPAKMAKGLVFRIIEHALEKGYIQPGGLVLDPFGGVGTTALPALMAGLNYIGVELEPRFVELGRKNIELWHSKFAGMPKWVGSAQLLQGDSRKLASVIAGAGLVVGSPPFISSLSSGQFSDKAIEELRRNGHKPGPAGNSASYGSTPGQLGAMVVGSPPFAGNTGGRGEASRNGIDAALFDRHSGGMKRGTGSDPANLDHLPQGEAPALIVGSPPYAESLKPETEDQTRRKQERIAKSKSLYDGRNLEVPSAGKAALGGGYGLTDGQLGAMVVGSPPYEGTNVGNGDGEKELRRLQKKAAAGQLRGEHLRLANQGRLSPHENANLAHYGQAENQLGNATGETFWAAAAVILGQCYQVLPVGGYAIWVTKRYVKAGKIVDFSGQWAALCEASGFEVVEWIRAWLIKNQGLAQVGIDGELVSKEIGRKSFFRRLHERKNPHLSIDWEDVLVMRKRSTPGGDVEAVG